MCNKPEDFNYEDQSLNITVRTFKVEKADMLDWLPESGDTLEWNNEVYTVRKYGTGTFYQDIGNYNVVIRIFVTDYRS